MTTKPSSSQVTQSNHTRRHTHTYSILRVCVCRCHLNIRAAAGRRIDPNVSKRTHPSTFTCGNHNIENLFCRSIEWLIVAAQVFMNGFNIHCVESTYRRTDHNTYVFVYPWVYSIRVSLYIFQIPLAEKRSWCTKWRTSVSSSFPYVCLRPGEFVFTSPTISGCGLYFEAHYCLDMTNLLQIM